MSFSNCGAYFFFPLLTFFFYSRSWFFSHFDLLLGGQLRSSPPSSRPHLLNFVKKRGKLCLLSLAQSPHLYHVVGDISPAGLESQSHDAESPATPPARRARALGHELYNIHFFRDFLLPYWFLSVLQTVDKCLWDIWILGMWSVIVTDFRERSSYV